MNQSREIKSFLFSQYFSDGLRITFGVLLPSLIAYQLDLLPVGLTISLGALCVSIADNPGPVVHKRNGMLFCSLFTFISALITGLINAHPVLIGIEIVTLCFFFSMFSVYGNRASSVGTAALLIMILTIDQDVIEGTGAWRHALYILAGGLWYMVLSLSLAQIRPYRMAQQTLGECIREIGNYIRLKANFYDATTDYDENYRKLVEQQVTVHQQQDAVREMLFKSRLMIRESTGTGRQLILVFVDILDLFEQTMATHYDYRSIRETYGQTEAMGKLKKLITEMSEELENLSYYIISNEKPQRLYHYKSRLEDLKASIDRVEDRGINTLVLKKILINLRNMASRIRKIYSYYSDLSVSGQTPVRSPEELNKFVSHQDFDTKVLRDNLTSNSSIFRHSVRVALMCLIGYLVSKLFPFGHHSYWILLTILVILKPAFSLTKQRNFQRLIGTLCGGIAGALILIYVDDQTALFVFLLIFMICAYSFQRLNYVVSVLFMTPYTLILFSFLGEGNLAVAQERIIDTFVGSFIALASTYIVLPNWEFHQLRNYMRQILVANYKYLYAAAEQLTGKNFDITAYKLVRKDVYVSSANLGSAFQRMLSEPKSKQQNHKEIHKFVVLNHILSSYIATLITNLQQPERPVTDKRHIKLIRKSLYMISEMIKKAGESDFQYNELVIPEELHEMIEGSDTRLLSEQLELISRVISDIQKLNLPQFRS